MNSYYEKENLIQIADGDPDFVKMLAQTFLEEIQQDLYFLNEAIKNDNRELAYQYAHKMKPNIEMFGIDGMKDITAIEVWTRSSKSVSAITPNIENLFTTLNFVFEELKRDFHL